MKNDRKQPAVGYIHTMRCRGCENQLPAGGKLSVLLSTAASVAHARQQGTERQYLRHGLVTNRGRIRLGNNNQTHFSR